MKVLLIASIVVPILLASVAAAENVTVCGSTFTFTILPQKPLVCLSVSGVAPSNSDPIPLIF